MGEYVGGLQAGVDAQLRRALADALLLLTPVRLGMCGAATTGLKSRSLRPPPRP